jgi:hypothetical protein
MWTCYKLARDDLITVSCTVIRPHLQERILETRERSKRVFVSPLFRYLGLIVGSLTVADAY